MYQGGAIMDRKLLKQLRKALVLESFFSGASSLSKIFNETEGELEDMIKYLEKKIKTKNQPDSKSFRDGKH